jgi:hypothetical protein
MSKLSPWELLDLRLSREGKPPSRALEQRYYGNPADVVQFEQEKQRKKKSGKKSKKRRRR